jgi:hypothetical protein
VAVKTLGKVLLGLLACVILLLVVFRITGLEPHNRTPGLWLKGALVTTPVNDWSFTDNVPQIHIQTSTWYFLPHSVTINCMAYNGQLYVASVYPAGTPKHHWNDDVVRDPHVRIQIGNELYDRTLAPVTDPAEREAVLQARAKKYPRLKIPPGAVIHIFHVIG